MRRILAIATIPAIVASVGSLFFVLLYMHVVGVAINVNVWLPALVIPLLFAYPNSTYLLWQRKKLADMLSGLDAAHADLAQTHAELARAYASLAEKSRRDDLTGLLNRAGFLSALKGEHARAGRGTLLIIDADHFKRINDTFGHQAGDAALRIIADAIRQGVRTQDLVGRIGGEEFAAYLPGCDAGRAMEFAERIRLGVETARIEDGADYAGQLSVSIGLAEKRPGADWQVLVREADRRLYEAKRNGRNRTVRGPEFLSVA